MSEKDKKELVDKSELLEQVKKELEDMPVKELVSVMATDLASVGFRRLGMKDAKQKDLDQAKLAIYSLDALIEVLAPHLKKEENDVLRAALSNLKMHYVKETK